MRRWLSNLGSAALALVLAVLVWVVAVREEYPRAQFTQPIPVNRTGLPDDVVDLPGINAIIANQGEASCMLCHGTNGVQ